MKKYIPCKFTHRANKRLQLSHRSCKLTSLAKFTYLYISVNVQFLHTEANLHTVKIHRYVKVCM